MRNYDSIVRKLVKKSFPSLRNSKFIVIERDIGIFSGMAIWIFPWFRLIVLHPRVDLLNDDFVTGLLAHELCHFEQFKKETWIGHMFRLIVYLCSEKNKILVERRTDAMVIEKGYVKEIKEVARKRYHSCAKMRDRYLSESDIERIRL